MSQGSRGERRRGEMHRRPLSNWSVEDLEGRVLLSGAAERPGPTASAAIQALYGRRVTTTSLQSSTKTGGPGNRVTFTAIVHTAGSNRLVTAGLVRFVVVSPNPSVIGSVHLNKLGQANIATSRLHDGESYTIEAQFVPTQAVYASSHGSVVVSVAMASASSFRINAPQFFGAPGTPVSFSVTAVDRAGQPVTDYSGTINLYSPTDHAAIFPVRQYTFTTADQGTHSFGVTFHKGGAEVLKVDQVSNTQIRGTAKFGIE
jgi:hypothetical protein